MRLKYYMRGVGCGIIFTLFVFVVIIIPNLKLESKINETKQSATENDAVSALVGKDNISNAPDDNDSELTPGTTDITNGADNADKADNADSTGNADKAENAENAENADSADNEESLTDAELLNNADATGEPTPTTTSAPTPTPTSAPTPTPTKAPTPTPTKAPTPTPTKAPTPTPTKAPTPTPTKAPTPTPTKAPTPTPTKAPTPTPVVKVDEDGVIRITIAKGMTSEKISKLLEDNGVVDDWKELNKYIGRNGYSEKIQVGTFKFTKNMSYREVCRTICGHNFK